MDGAKIVIGGQTDEKDLYIEPTVLIDVKPTDAVMQEEVNLYSIYNLCGSNRGLILDL